MDSMDITYVYVQTLFLPLILSTHTTLLLAFIIPVALVYEGAHPLGPAMPWMSPLNPSWTREPGSAGGNKEPSLCFIVWKVATK